MHEDFTERAVVPLGWWLIGIAVALTFAVAVVFFLGPWWALAATVVCVGAVVAVLIGYGSLRIAVSAQGLQVGRSTIAWRYVAQIKPLDAVAMRERHGPRADPAAFLAVRPYIRTGVEVVLDDRDDPHPYWLVSTRHPQRLAHRVRERLGTERAHSTGRTDGPRAGSVAPDGG